MRKAQWQQLPYLSKLSYGEPSSQKLRIILPGLEKLIVAS